MSSTPPNVLVNTDAKVREPAARRPPNIRGQLATCLLLVAVAAVIAALFPQVSSWRSTQTLAFQAAFVAASAVLGVAGVFVAVRVPFFARRVQVPVALAAIDLSGSKPVVVGLAAGIGEELLFRAALLPLLGLWGSSAAFALAHLRTASFASGWPQRIVYVAGTFVAGITLGLVFVHVGLLAVIGVHALIDIVSLSTIHQIRSLRSAEAAT
jgi:uncharacterized protein